MKFENIKPIPKYIVERIRKTDLKTYPEQNGSTRFYSYLTKNSGELVKVTVAVKNKYKKWYCKQCAVHGVHSDRCFLKDMCYSYTGGYVVGWYEEGLQKYQKWYEYGEWGWSDDKYFDPYTPIVNREFLTKFPEYKYSAIELYNASDIFRYLRMYEKYPQIEYLAKLGLNSLLFSTQILRKIGTDKNFRKWLIRHKDKLINRHYYIDVILRAYRTGKSLDHLQAYRQAKIKLKHSRNSSEIRNLFKGQELEKFLNYIAEQNTNLNTYTDYLNACNDLSLDMSLPKNRFPHNFRYWHDMRIDQYATAKAITDEKERKELYKQFASVAEKYLPLQHMKRHSFICMIARSPAELIQEGIKLNHCVGRMNYDQRVVREESLIFFVREKEQPDTPFVTVEYSPSQHKVLQCYGKDDQKPDATVLEYVNKIWLPYANRTLKQLAA